MPKTCACRDQFPRSGRWKPTQANPIDYGTKASCLPHNEIVVTVGELAPHYKRPHSQTCTNESSKTFQRHGTVNVGKPRPDLHGLSLQRGERFCKDGCVFFCQLCQ